MPTEMQTEKFQSREEKSVKNIAQPFYPCRQQVKQPAGNSFTQRASRMLTRKVHSSAVSPWRPQPNTKATALKANGHVSQLWGLLCIPLCPNSMHKYIQGKNNQRGDPKGTYPHSGVSRPSSWWQSAGYCGWSKFQFSAQFRASINCVASFWQSIGQVPSLYKHMFSWIVKI